MLRYILKRILLFIPTLIIISLLAFIISVNAPGDPVEILSNAAMSGEAGGQTQVQKEENAMLRKKLGLDLPLFYFSITPLSYPDTLYKIVDEQERDVLQSLLHSFGNWNAISNYDHQLHKLQRSLNNIHIDSVALKKFSGDEIHEAINQARFDVSMLFHSADDFVIQQKLKELDSLFTHHDFFEEQKNCLQLVSADYDAMKSQRATWKNFIPTLHFHLHNQYHRWLFGDGNMLTGGGSVYSKGLIRGDLGISYTTKRGVNEMIWSHIGWSLLFTFISVILSYLIAIPIGIRAAVKRGKAYDHISSVILFVLHSMPVFWVGTLLLMSFANPDVLKWFPASGIKPDTGYPAGASFFLKMQLTLPYLILPAITYTYSSLAYLSRIMRVSMLEVLNLDFIRTARAKGLPERTVIYKHAFRNALLPIITLFANILPFAIGGSVVIEFIFNIPGMGLLTYSSIQNQDYPVIVGIFTIAGVLTLIGYLIADVLYAVADPRISFSKR